METSELIKSFNDKLREAQAQVDLIDGDSETPVIKGLANDLKGKWEDAMNARVSKIDPRLVKCKRARKGEYDPKKLSEIRATYPGWQHPPFAPIIPSKCRDAEAWLRGNYVRPDVDIWDLRPTAMPDLPEAIERKIAQSVTENMFKNVIAQSQTSGQPITPDAIMKSIEEMLPLVKDAVHRKIIEKAKESVSRMKKLIETQFAKGGFDDAIRDFIYNFVTYPSAFMEGPIQRKKKVMTRIYDEATGKWVNEIEEQIVDFYESFSPWDAYPQRQAKNINDGYFFRKMTTTPKDLSDCIGIPGYDDDAIKRTLVKYRRGGLHEWTNTDAVRADLEDQDSVSVNTSDKIDMLKFFGTVEGNKLIEWGLPENDIPDGDLEYACICYMIGDEVIKAMLNQDPLGKKNIHKASFIEDPDNFWGLLSLPEFLWDIQNAANAALRGMVLNIGYAAAPIFEYDKNAFPDGVPATFYPGMKLARTTEQMAQGAPDAFKVHKIPYIGAQLQQTYDFLRTLADEYSGIPRRPDRARGAGRSATGYSMQLSEEARGLQSISVNIDDVIRDLVTAQYELNLMYEDIDLIGGANIIAKGALMVMAKEQTAIRLKETLQESNNPVDAQIIDINARRKLWKTLLQSFPVDTDDILPDEMEAMGKIQELVGRVMPATGKAPAPKPVSTDEAGNVLPNQPGAMIQ